MSLEQALTAQADASAAQADSYVRELATLPRSTLEMLLPIPPSEIRYRVVNRRENKLQHLKTGLAVKSSIEHALLQIGRPFGDFSAVLDWGCGCSRVLRHWLPELGDATLTGFDVDEVTVEWSRRNIVGVHFAVNAADPPLPSPDASFDLIYGASVFSHLDEARQAAWLHELHRVLVPGGVVVLSTHGQFALDFARSEVPPQNIAEFESGGFTFLSNIRDGVLPEWYQTSFQSEAHVRRTFGHVFEIERFIPTGMTGFQDLVICRKV